MRLTPSQVTRAKRQSTGAPDPVLPKKVKLAPSDWRNTPAGDYMEGVMTGEIPACKSIRLAVERAVDDHENAHKRGLYFDVQAVELARRWMGLCVMTSGRWRGKPFNQAPWQLFCASELFGWKTKAGLRRYNTAMISVPKKNGKSTWAAAILVYMFAGDGENAAQVYTLAAKRDQARIVFDEARRMVQMSPGLKQHIVVYQHHMSIPAAFSKCEPLSSDTDTVDGFNPSFVILDELHRHKSRALWDLSQNSTDAREQPLMLAITTSGDNLISIAHEQHEYAMSLLKRSFDNDDYFAYIVEPDKDYDWRSEKEWEKCNPSLGVTIDKKAIKRAARKAQQSPQEAAAFRRYRLNEWVNEAAKWMDLDAWKACAHQPPLEELEGEICFGGLDLALTRDMSCFMKLFVAGEYIALVPTYYCCEQSIIDRSKIDRLPYNLWAEQGLIKITPGPVTDMGYIQEDIERECERYSILEIGADPYQCTQMANWLEDRGITVVYVRQGAMDLGEPMEVLMRYVLNRKIIHYNHPILRWNAMNVVARVNANKIMAPDKQRSVDKIDGISATLCALHRMIGNRDDNQECVYEHTMPLVVGMR